MGYNFAASGTVSSLLPMPDLDKQNQKFANSISEPYGLFNVNY